MIEARTLLSGCKYFSGFVISEMAVAISDFFILDFKRVTNVTL